jgi:hypothetical protein
MNDLKKLIQQFTRKDGIVEIHESKLYSALAKIQFQLDNLKYHISELEKREQK